MGGGGREELKWRQPAHHKLWNQLNSMMKAHSVSSGISDVVITSVHLEKTRLKKLMMMMIKIVMNKSQETMVFSGRQKLTSAMKLRTKSDGRLQI